MHLHLPELSTGMVHTQGHTSSRTPAHLWSSQKRKVVSSWLIVSLAWPLHLSDCSPAWCTSGTHFLQDSHTPPVITRRESCLFMVDSEPCMATPSSQLLPWRVHTQGHIAAEIPGNLQSSTERNVFFSGPKKNSAMQLHLLSDPWAWCTPWDTLLSGLPCTSGQRTERWSLHS